MSMQQQTPPVQQVPQTQSRTGSQLPGTVVGIVVGMLGLWFYQSIIAPNAWRNPVHVWVASTVDPIATFITWAGYLGLPLLAIVAVLLFFHWKR